MLWVNKQTFTAQDMLTPGLQTGTTEAKES